MAAVDASPATENRSNALKLAALGGLSGAIAWGLVNYAEPLNIQFEVERFGLLLLPVGIFPGAVFGVLFAIILVLQHRTTWLRAAGYILASTASYMAAFQIAFYILGNLQHGAGGGMSLLVYVVSGVPAGFVGSSLLGWLTRLWFPQAGRQLFARSVVVGTLAGALLGLASVDDHNGLGFLAFFILWQGAYAACLAPLLQRRA